MKKFLFASLICVFAAVAANAGVVLTFEGVGDELPVLNFYNGGAGGSLGISFGPDALGIVDSDAGGTGNFANEPSPSTILFFLGGQGAVMNVAAGFTTGFSFFYAAANNPGVVTVWDGLDASGNLIGTLNLAANGSSCGGDPNGAFNCWTALGAAFAGTARSVNFSGTANQIGFDNVSIGSEIPGGDVPEPATFIVAGSGMLALVLRRRLRRS
jgi:hypothetical protein